MGARIPDDDQINIGARHLHSGLPLQDPAGLRIRMQYPLEGTLKQSNLWCW
jgi:hypothetical protein